MEVGALDTLYYRMCLPRATYELVVTLIPNATGVRNLLDH